MIVVHRLARLLDRPVARRAVLIVTGIGLLLLVSRGGPLGWDEAVYSAKGKDLAESRFDWSSASGPYWSDLRAPGFPVVQAVAFMIFGVSDAVARLVTVVFSLALIDVVARTLDLWWRPRVGTTAMLLAATCPGFIATSTLAFADNPAAYPAALAVWVFARSVRRRSSEGLFWVPILIGVATTARFGAIFLIAGALVVLGGLLLFRSVVDRDPRSLIPYLLTGTVSVGVVVILLWTRLLTESASPIGAKSARLNDVQRAGDQWLTDLRLILNPGPVDYGFNGAFWGWSYAIAFGVLAVIAVTRLVVTSRWVELLVCGTVSVLPVLLYAVTVKQFVTTYLSPIFVVGAAAVAIGLWAGIDLDEVVDDEVVDDEVQGVQWSERLATAFVAVGALGLVVVGVNTFRGVQRMHDRLDGFEQVSLVSTAADDLLGSNCRLATSRVPQVAWYSDCRVASFAGEPPVDASQFDEYAALQSRRLGADDGVVGFVILEGVSGQPNIDLAWSERIEGQSVALVGRSDRRTVLVALEVP